MTVREEALAEILTWLSGAGYAFTSPTPSTHSLVRNRRNACGNDLLRDIFGWTRAFVADQIPAALLSLMQAAEAVEACPEGLVSRIRVSDIDGRLHLHSAAMAARDAVFLGPDSYRFTRLVQQMMAEGVAVRRALDIGTGAGAGALTVLAAFPDCQVLGSDINPEALRFAGINARHAGLSLQTCLGSGIPEGGDPFDLIIANPPYIAGSGGRTYRDGGDALGTALGLDWVRTGFGRLVPGGRIILYTGSPIVAGQDHVRSALETLVERRQGRLAYAEIDPDVFGSTLSREAYREVERIAAIGAVLTAPQLGGAQE